MAKLTQAERDRLITLTVETLLEIRRAYLASPGASPLKNWDMLTSRLKIASRTSPNPNAWVTCMLDRMNIASAPSVSSSRCFLELSSEVQERRVFVQWREILNREWGLLIAKTRLCAEEQAAAKHTAKQEASP